MLLQAATEGAVGMIAGGAGLGTALGAGWAVRRLASDALDRLGSVEKRLGRVELDVGIIIATQERRGSSRE